MNGVVSSYCQIFFVGGGDTVDKIEYCNAIMKFQVDILNLPNLKSAKFLKFLSLK